MGQQYLKTTAAGKVTARQPLAVAVQVDWQDRRAVGALMCRMEQVLTPELLQDKYSADPRYQKLNPTTGHCSAATEALWYAIGNWETPYRDHWAYDTKAGRERQANGKPRADHDTTHHWLQIPGTEPDPQTNLFDPTAKQYTQRHHPDGRKVSIEPPYDHGIAAGFQTRVPSRRAQAVLDRVANSLVKRPLKGVAVDPTLIHDRHAGVKKAYDPHNYARLKAIYDQRLQPNYRMPPGIKSAKHPAHSASAGHDAHSQQP